MGISSTRACIPPRVSLKRSRESGGGAHRPNLDRNLRVRKYDPGYYWQVAGVGCPRRRAVERVLMSKTVVFLFHDDDASLRWGSRLAEGIASAEEEDVELEVFCFGPAQSALAATPGETAERVEYRERIDRLAAAGVRVSTCRSAAESAGMIEEMTKRGIALESPRNQMVQYAREGAVVLNF